MENNTPAYTQFLLFVVMPVFVFGGLCLWENRVEAFPKKSFTDDEAVAAIVGEAANQGEFGMRLVAHAIRNRGTLKGVFGVKALHNRTEPHSVWMLARIVWKDSARYPDPTLGADSWYSLEDEAKNGVPEGKVEIVRYLDHIFYKTTKNPRRTP